MHTVKRPKLFNHQNIYQSFSKYQICKMDFKYPVEWKITLLVCSVVCHLSWIVSFSINFTKIAFWQQIFFTTLIMFDWIILALVVYQTFKTSFLNNYDQNFQIIGLTIRSLTYVNTQLNKQIQATAFNSMLEISLQMSILLLFVGKAKQRFQNWLIVVYLISCLLSVVKLDDAHSWVEILAYYVMVFLMQIKMSTMRQESPKQNERQIKFSRGSPRYCTKDDYSIYKSPFAQSYRGYENFSLLPFSMVVTNAQCEIKYFNQAFSRLFRSEDISYLQKALVSVRIELPQKSTAPHQSRERISFFDSLTCETLDNYLQNVFQKCIALETLNFINVFDSNILSPGCVLGIQQSDNFATQGKDAEFFIIFLNMDAYQKTISRKMSLVLLKQMFKSFSHEFATSLNCIQGLAQHSLDSLEDMFIRENIIRPILYSSCIMNSIVQDIRDFNEFLSQSFEMSIDDDVDIVETIRSVEQMFSIHFRQKGINFQIQMDRRCKPIIHTDRLRLSQVLTNLVSNAQKNTHKGQIEINVKSWIHDNEDFIKIEVEDTGVGISDENKERINSILNMGLNQSKQNPNNTFGFGLMISNLILQNLGNLARGHGGGIHFSSRLGYGSKFWFLIRDFVANSDPPSKSNIHIKLESAMLYRRETLHSKFFRRVSNKQGSMNLTESKRLRKETFTIDIAEDIINGHGSEQLKRQEWQVRNPAYKTQKNRTEDTMKCNCNHVLVVDDELFNILAIQALLHSFDIESDAALSGMEALHKYEDRINNPCLSCNQNYQVIFLDINMPVLDGFETAKKILKLSPNYKNQPQLVAQTAFCDSETLNLSFQSGIRYFMTKPLQKADLAKILHQIEMFDNQLHQTNF